MKIDATIILIHSYSTISIKVDKHINLEDLVELAGIEGHVLFTPHFFVLKEEKPLEGNEDGFFFAITVSRKRKVSPFLRRERQVSKLSEEDCDEKF